MIESDSPPVLDFVADDRFLKVKKTFVQKYGSDPTHYSRAPGRVNLIGEHVDYMGYSVLPMAIEHDVMIAGKLNDTGTLRLCNTDSKYRLANPVKFHGISRIYPQQLNYSRLATRISWLLKQCASLQIVFMASQSYRQLKWYHYFLCGYRGMVEHLQLSDRPGIDLTLSGRVPPSAGLSSSSALVCAAALITSALYGQEAKEITKSDFAQICCDCERFIGTQGGGMDQSISFLAEKGKAKHIEFDPIRASDVFLPEGYAFVIGHSLAEANKAATSDFNRRVVECRIAAQLIAKQRNLEWRNFKKLGDVQAKLGYSYSQMEELVAGMSCLHTETGTLSKDAVCALLEVTPDELNTTTLSQNTLSVTEFRVLDRARHVFGEARRTQEFLEACQSGQSGDDIAKSLGKLLNRSHESLKDLYDCSHPNLDALTQICRDSGALGSRLTGAGWGGCCVSLVRLDQLEEFLLKVKNRYYSDEKLGGRDINQVLFGSVPAAGASIMQT